MSINELTYSGKDNELAINSGIDLSTGQLQFGTVAVPLSLGTDTDAVGARFNWTSAAVTGTVRGIDTRLALTAGAGGEALRSVLTCSDDTPADTINGAHLSLHFGASAGNVTGLATASRNTIMVPARTVGGTCAAVQAELYAEGTTSTFSNGSLLRLCIDGNATGKALLEDAVYAINFATGTNAASNVVGTMGGSEPTWTGHTGLIRCIANGVPIWLVAVDNG